MEAVVVRARAAAAIRRSRRPWILAEDLARAADAPRSAGGAVVRFVGGDDGVGIGVGYYNAAAPRLRGRVLAWGADAAAPDAEWYAARIAGALARRRPWGGDTAAGRLVHAEADGMPGLTVDRIGDGVVVAHSDVAGVHGAWPMIRAGLQETVPGVRTIVLRASPRGGAEPLPPRPAGAAPLPEVTGDPLPATGTVPLLEHGVRYRVPVLAGQKTGWYFDQTGNRALVARLVSEIARGRRARAAPGTAAATVLDVCCYLGGFGLAAAAASDAVHATLVDSSALALALAQEAATENGLGSRVQCVQGTATKTLADLGAAGRTFDVVVLDPPPFARSAAAVEAASAGYFHLVKLACALVAPSGYLFFSTCSHAITADLITGMVRNAARGAGRSARLVARPTAGPDHPVLLALPETEYLRAVLVQLDPS